MTTTPLPPLPKPDIWSHVVTVWRDEVECQIDQGPRFTADQMQAYATAARADLEAENQRLREALDDIAYRVDIDSLRAAIDRASAALENRA